MPEVIATSEARVFGLWRTVHRFDGAGGLEGTLTVERNAFGLVVRARYAPVKGEVLILRRDPGILRSQFSLWTENREWLGSSLRSSWVKPEIALSTGNKPYRLVPLPRFGRGWRILAPKTGEMARLLPSFSGRSTRLEVYRRLDPELLVFAYFLGWQVFRESWWPGRHDEGEGETVPAPSKT